MRLSCAKLPWEGRMGPLSHAGKAASGGGVLSLTQEEQGRARVRSPRHPAATEQGGSRLQLLIALLIVAAIILAAVRITPVYVSSYEFEDAMRSQAKYAGVNRKAPQQIQQELHRKALELSLPLERKQISVTPAARGVRIAARYTVPVDLVVYTANFTFDFQADTGSVY